MHVEPPLPSTDRSGQALAMALIVVTVVALLGVGFLRLSSSLTRRQGSVVDEQRAFYIAEAGLAEAFQAVRIGRSGQVGSLAAPARLGRGLVWVDVLERADGSLLLESTGLAGTGRSTLALSLEPIEQALGFFADEDLIVDAVVLVDGYDSSEGSYSEQIASRRVLVDRDYPWLHDDPVNKVAFYEGVFYRYTKFGDVKLDYVAMVPLATLAADPEYAGGYGIDVDDFTGDASFADFAGLEYDGVLAWFDEQAESDESEDASLGELAPAPASALGPTTGQGGLLASNGGIQLTPPSGESLEIWGDVVPGRGNGVTVIGDAFISGENDPRATEVELPPVDVPLVSLAPTVRHDGLLPLLLPTGTSGHGRIEVAAGAELVLRGPATVVIGELVLEEGAALTIDTRLGNVAVYVTTEIDLRPGSTVTHTDEDPEATAVQFGAVPDSPVDPAVKLDATGSFYGTVYAPDADVRIGGNFEVHGGVVARRQRIEPGARLHFDRAGFGDSPIPRIVGWRVVEVPAEVRDRRRDPFELFGLRAEDLKPLSEAHDLAAVQLHVEYVDTGGARRTFDGSEDLFNWGLVAEVVSIDRAATRPKEEPGATADPASDPPPKDPPVDDTTVRDAVKDSMLALSDSELKDALVAIAPLTTAEIMLMLDQAPLMSSDIKTVLNECVPLDGSVLERMLTQPTAIQSSDLKALLENAYPLSSDQILMVEENRLGTLSPTDQTNVLKDYK